MTRNAIQHVVSDLAMAVLQKTLDRDQSISIPSLDIVIAPEGAKMIDMINISEIQGPLPSHCPQCGKIDDGTVAIYCQNTSYADSHRNYLTCCKDCLEENDSYWAERWEEYYSMRL